MVIFCPKQINLSSICLFLQLMRSVNNVINPQIDYTPTTVYRAHLQQASRLRLFLRIFQTLAKNVPDKSDKTDISSVEIPRNCNCFGENVFFTPMKCFVDRKCAFCVFLLLLKIFSTSTRELNLQQELLRTRLSVIVIQMKLCSNLALVLLLE